MAVTLPYKFDTARHPMLIVKGMLGLEFIVIVPGIIYTLISRRSLAMVLPLILAGAILLYFIVRFIKHLEGSAGIITGTEIVVTPRRVCGLRLPGPAGTYSIHEFSAVRVEEISGPSSPDVQGGPHERIYLVGKYGTPDILIARANRTDPEDGISLGRGFGGLLKLPLEQERMPY